MRLECAIWRVSKLSATEQAHVSVNSSRGEQERARDRIRELTGTVTSEFESLCVLSSRLNGDASATPTQRARRETKAATERGDSTDIPLSVDSPLDCHC